MFSSESGSFIVHISSGRDSPFVDPSRAIHINPGHRAKVTVTATLHQTDNELVEDFTKEERGCQTEEEKIWKGFDLFAYYSQSTCLLECKIKKV